MENHVTMESPIKERTVTDIGKTVEKHAGIVTDILASHALTGCDTVACYYGIGKGTALKVLRAGQHSLSLLGYIESPIETVIAQATSFMSACYGVHSCKSMSEARWRVWASKTGHASSPPKLCSLQTNKWGICRKCEKSSSPSYCLAFPAAIESTGNGSRIAWLDQGHKVKNSATSPLSS